MNSYRWIEGHRPRQSTPFFSTDEVVPLLKHCNYKKFSEISKKIKDAHAIIAMHWPTSISLPCLLILLTSTVVQPIVSSCFTFQFYFNYWNSSGSKFVCHLSYLVFVKDFHFNLVLIASVDVQVVFPNRLQGLLTHLAPFMSTQEDIFHHVQTFVS